MGVLADELGVNRVTLYRWFGSRDDFLVEVIWSLALRTFDYVEEKVSARRWSLPPLAARARSSARQSPRIWGSSRP